MSTITGNATPSVSPAATATDRRIEDSFKKTHVYTTYLKNAMITITSKDGDVTLAGGVPVADHKPMAGYTAEALPGVKRVDNRIDIADKPDAENSDLWILAKVKAALLFHRNVSASGTEVDVKDGVVILRGAAASAAQRELTTEFAKGVVGVKDVRNEMTVAPTAWDAKPGAAGFIERAAHDVADFIDDASVTAQVRMSLLLHRSTSALRTTVATHDGVVILSGDASNLAEREMVAKIVADVNGVKSVVNNMTVGPGAPAGA